MLLGSTTLFAKDLSIFFLKDGAIVQGKIVNENAFRVFLKTEQGTIKILHEDILGREDLAKEGDLSYLKDRVDYLQSNLQFVTGEMNHLNDSLKLAVDDLLELYRNIEVLQNEFEIDLLRVHGRTREQTKEIKYIQNMLGHHKVDIASGRQSLTTINDTLKQLSKSQHSANQKLEVTSNQTFLISGSLSQLDSKINHSDIQIESQQNQLNIMANSLANVIREVESLVSSLSQIRNDIATNNESINKIGGELKEETTAITNQIKSFQDNFNSTTARLSSLIEEVENKGVASSNQLNKEINQLKTDLNKTKTDLEKQRKIDLKTLRSEIEKMNQEAES